MKSNFVYPRINHFPLVGLFFFFCEEKSPARVTAPRFELTSQRQKVSRLPTEPPGRPAHYFISFDCRPLFLPSAFFLRRASHSLSLLVVFCLFILFLLFEFVFLVVFPVLCPYLTATFFAGYFSSPLPSVLFPRFFSTTTVSPVGFGLVWFCISCEIRGESIVVRDKQTTTTHEISTVFRDEVYIIYTVNRHPVGPESIRSRKCVPMAFTAESPPAQGQSSSR